MTVMGSTQQNPMMLTNTPALPRLNRSLGIGGPKNRLQMVQPIHRVYEKLREQPMMEMMALKPTTGPKLMQAIAQANAMVTQTARLGVSASGTGSR